MSVVEQMLARYQGATPAVQTHAWREIVQEIALAGLNRGGFFDKAAFYGGTCLRIFHRLPRFSEDLDFSLLKPDPGFTLEPWLLPLQNEFRAFGLEAEVTQKQKSVETAIVSAFLKQSSGVYQLQVDGKKSIKIKLEVDTDPPLGFSTDEQLLLLPYSFYTKCFSLSDLFAGKMHALMYRTWKTRVKGRDWFDFEWYVRSGHSLHLAHFELRARQSGDLSTEAISLTPENFLVLLKQRIAVLDINAAKHDVEPFLRDASALDIWSTQYFTQLADMIKFV